MASVPLRSLNPPAMTMTTTMMPSAMVARSLPNVAATATSESSMKTA